MLSWNEFLIDWVFVYGPLSIFFIGLYGLMTQKNLLKIVISIDIMDLGVNLFIVSLGYVKNGVAPIYTSKNLIFIKNFVDPLPQALVLTAIVISVAVSAFVLSLTIKIYEKYKTVDIDKLNTLED